MTDFASLGIKIDSSSVPRAVSDLDRLTAAGNRAEGATTRLGGSSKGAAIGAAAMAAQAQASARSTLSMGAGATAAASAMKSLGTHTQGSALQIRELLVLTREASVGNFTRMAGSASILATSLATTGTNVGGLISRLLTMVGILKVTENAELSLAAADAAAGAAGIKAAAERAASNIVAADTELALARAALRVATTSEAEALAQTQVAAAHEAVAAAAAEATIAEDALAVAMESEAAAATAASEATIVALAPLAGILAAVAAVLALVGAAFEGIKQGAEDADPSAKNLIATLGLTHKEIQRLKDTTVTWGDTFGATLDVMAEKAGTSTADIKKFFSDSFHSIGEFGKFSVAIIIAAFAAGFQAIKAQWFQLPAIIGEAAIGAANLAVSGIEQLVNLGISGINKLSSLINNSLIGQGIKLTFGVELPTIAAVSLGRIKNQFAGTFTGIGKQISSTFYNTFNSVEATFDQISARANERRDQRVRDQANEMLADRTGHAAAAHRDRAKAANEEADALDRLQAAIDKALARPSEVDLGVDPTARLSSGPGKDFLQVSQDDLLAGPNALLEKLQEIADQAQVTGQVMADAFGAAGNVFGGIIANMADYQSAQQALAIDVLKGSKTQEQADKTLSTLRARSTAMALSGLKSLFKEHSTGYKVMSAIEKAYALFQAAETIASIVRDTSKTASSVANSAVRTTANTAEGGSKIFAELGPWAFPVVAAMVAVLAALGASSGGGGSAGPKIPTADDIQAGNGAGSILGDSKAKSTSIANSLELVAQNSNKDLEYSNAMLKSLRNIDFSISKLAGTVARQIQVSGSLFDTSKLRLGDSGSKGFLGLIGGSTTSRTLFDLGINLAASSVGNIIADGITGSSYQIVQKIKTSSGFLGIGGGTKTSYTTTTGAIDPEITKAIQDVIHSLRDGLVTAAGVIGLEGAAAILDSFQVSIGKISFKDLTGKEIEDQLNAVFSKVGDEMAGALFPTLATMQKIGEGLFETFIRVAREYEVIDLELKSIGKTFGAVGVGSIAARDALVQLFESLDDFVEKTDFFRDQFLTDAERIAPVQASVAAEMQRLGLAGVVTRDQFKAVVLGLDLTTAAGREMYASLLAVAPAFDKVLDYFDQVNKATIQSLQATIDQFSKFADSLKKYRDTLFATDASQGNAYAILKARFNSTAALAATGDATALGGLEGAGKDFLTSAKANASTWLQYQRDVALVARGVDKGIFAAETTADYAQLQLNELTNATTILGTIATNTAATAAVLGAPVSTPAGVTPGSGGGTSDPALVAEIAALRTDLNAALQAIATNTGSSDRTLKRWDRGDTLAITVDSDDPIDVNLAGWGGDVSS